METTAIQLLHEYGALQERLCDALFDRYPIEDVNLLLDLPKRGILSVGDDLWEFQRHGVGVCFTNIPAKEIVDAHVAPATQPGGIDSWRLVQYLESRGIGTLHHETMQYDATSTESLDAMLEQLCRMGLLIVANQKRRIYSLLHRVSDAMPLA